MALSDVVKASDEDLAWLYPGVDPAESLCGSGPTLGPSLVVMTRGTVATALARLAHDDVEGLEVAVALRLLDLVRRIPSRRRAILVHGGPAGRAARHRRPPGHHAGWPRRSGPARIGTVGGRGPAPTTGGTPLTSAITVGRAGAYAPGPDEVAALDAATSIV